MTNDLWVFPFQTIDAGCVKWASSARIYAFNVNLNKCLKPFLLDQHINIESRFKAFGLSVDVMKNVLEDLKVLRRSPDRLNNVKIVQGQLQLIMEQILFYHLWGL